MLTRLRSSWLAGGGAVLLVMSVSGMAAAATLVSDSTDPLVAPGDPAVGATDTTLTFEDVDGNTIDDDCQDLAPVALPDVAAAAFAAADLDGDGTISTSEAAQSDWVGGTNCNHGGYVSGVAGAPDGCDDSQASAGTTDEGSDQVQRDERRPGRNDGCRDGCLRADTRDDRPAARGMHATCRARAGGRGAGRYQPERPWQGRLQGRPVRRGGWQELQPRRRGQRGGQEGPLRPAWQRREGQPRQRQGQGPRQALVATEQADDGPRRGDAPRAFRFSPAADPPAGRGARPA